MIVIKNQLIPLPGYKAMTVWPLLFVRAKYMTETDMRHEEIHGRQQREVLPIAGALCALMWVVGCGWWSLLALPLYLWLYVGLYLAAMIGKTENPYKDNPLEKEAYFFEGDTDYLERRKPFAWVRFLKY